MVVYHNPERQCYGKLRFRTKRIAKAYARQLEAKIGARLHCYHCPWCWWYHMGNHRKPSAQQATMSEESFTESEEIFSVHIDNPNVVG